MQKLTLDERLNQIESKISEKSFRENKGLGNEVGYYVFDYDPRQEINVREYIKYLKDRINNGNKEFKIIESGFVGKDMPLHTRIIMAGEESLWSKKVRN